MMAQSNPAPSPPHPPFLSVKPKEKESPSEMVAQDEQIQSLHSRDGNVGLQNQKKADMVVEEEREGGEMSIKGTLLSHDIRPDGRCPEGHEERSMGDTHELEHPADEASHVSMSGSLRSGNFERDRGNIADCRHGSNRELQEVQGKMRDMHVSDSQGKPATESVIRKGDDGPAGHSKGQSESTKSGTKPAEAVPPNETTRAGNGGGEGRAGGGGEGGSKREAEAALFPMQSSDSSQQTFSQETQSKQSEDRVHSLHSCRSEPDMSTSHYSPPSSAALHRSQSFQTNPRREHYDMLLIYTEEDESSCANLFRSYAASKSWKVTSTAELPIGRLSLTNFRKAMECCSYVVLLISSHFISDKACERHYNIAIQYGDKNPDFADCVLPIIFDRAELPPELDAIQHVTWGNQYFDNVLTKSVDVQKRLDRELQEAASVSSTSYPPSRAISVDANISRTSFSQMASTPPSLSTVPAPVTVHRSESYQTSAASQQPIVQRVPEQEACLMPSADQSPVLPPIPVAKTPDVGTTQSLPTGVAAATTGYQPQNARTTSIQLRSAPEYGTKLPHQPVASATSQQQAAYHQQPGRATTQYQPSQNPEAVTGISLQSSGAIVTQSSSHIPQAHQQQTHFPATYQPQVTYQQQVSMTATHYQPSQHAEASATHLQHSLSSASPPGACNIPAQVQRTISHPAQDYENMTGEQIFRSLSPEFNPGQAASQMLSANRFGQICELLDADDIRGFDWRFLAETLDLSQAQIAILKKNGTGATRMVLEVFFLKNGTMGKIEALEKLMETLKMMKREDAAAHVEKEIIITKCKGR